MEINEVKLSKNMFKKEVNELVSNWILLEDEIFNGGNQSHIWKCKCGNLIKRRWDDIRRRKDILCQDCIQREKYKSQVEKDEDYEYIQAFKKGEILPNGKIAHAPYIQVKHKYCGSIYEVQVGQFINRGKRCGKCCISYENSFAHYIEVGLGLKLEDVWDFEKNTVNPYHIYKSGSEKVWIKCQSKEVNELNGLMKKDYHPSSLVICNNFTKGVKCQYCTSKQTHVYDSFGYHNFSKTMSWHSDNDTSPFRVSLGCNSKYKFVCETCGHEWEAIIHNIVRDRWCPECRSSRGEKRIKQWLDMNNIEYAHDEPYFDDLLSDFNIPLRPDFILPEHKVWIEYDGEFHFKPIYSEKELQRQQIYDKRKDDYADKHGWKMIRIKYTKFDNIEDILEKELNNITQE